MNKIKTLDNYQEKTFEDIKHIEDGHEYWFARELYLTLEYASWNKFLNVIRKAKIACTKSNNNSDDHFSHMEKMVKTGDSFRKVVDYKLSRYACYLIVQNADSNKRVVALGQTYFAIQTRKQELNEIEFNLLSENEKRFYIRRQTKDGNYSLQQVAKKAGVKNMDQFHNAGYKGLYNGESADDIFKRKSFDIVKIF